MVEAHSRGVRGVLVRLMAAEVRTARIDPANEPLVVEILLAHGYRAKLVHSLLTDVMRAVRPI